MSKLNSFSQLDKAMMDSPVYRNERAFEERSKREEEHKARLQEVDKLTDGIPLDRLREICAAERDGRCVVLPCKIKENCFVVSHTDQTITEITVSEFSYSVWHDAWVVAAANGGQFFLANAYRTRAEAEAALKGE